MKPKDKIKARRLFLLFLLYLPLHVALNPSPSIALASSRVIITLFFLYWLIWSLAHKKVDIPFQPQTFFLLLFCALSFISLLKAEKISWGVRKLLVFVSIWPLYFVAAEYFKDRTTYFKAGKTIFISGVISAIIGIGQFCLQFVITKEKFFTIWTNKIAPIFIGSDVAETVAEHPSWWVNIRGNTVLRAFGTFPDPHMLSFYLGMSLPFGLLFFQCRKKSFKKYFFLTTSYLILITAFFLTFSRGAYLGLTATLCMFLVLIWKNLTSKYKKRILTAILIIILLFLTIGPLKARFLSTFNLQGGAVKGRIKIWKKATSVLKNHPLLGVGIGNYAYFQKHGASYRLPVYAHNTYLDIGAEMGIFAIISWVGLLLAGFIRSAKHFSRARKNKNKLVNLAICGALTYFSVHTLFETPLYSPRILPLLAIVLALSLNKPPKISNS